MVQLTKPESMTKAGIIIPDQAQKESTEAVVIDVSEDIADVEPGDNVIVEPYAGYEIAVDDNQYLILDNRYVLAVIA